MTRLVLLLDKTCDTCMATLTTLRKEEATVDRDTYGARKKGTMKFVKPYLLRPDRNSAGVVTHWHLELEKEQEG